MESHTPDRRSLLRGALAGGAFLAAPGLLTACGPGGSSGDGSDPNAGVKLPNYVPYELGVKPDLPGTADGVPDFYLQEVTKFVDAVKGKPGDGKPITCMTATPNAIVPPVDRNPYWQELNKRCGSDLDITIVPGANYDDRFAVTVSGGDLPDWFYMGKMNRIPEFLESQCVDLTEYLSGDAVEEYPFLASIPTDSWKGTLYNGGIYGLPLPRGIGVTFMLSIRTDVCRKKGVDPFPKTVDDMMATAKELSDPAKGVWAFTKPPMIVLPQMYGLQNYWSAEGGKFSHMIEDERYLEALSTGRKIVQQDLMHPDGVGTPPIKTKEWFVEGSALISEDTFTGLRGFYQMLTIPDGFSADWMPLPTEDGSPGTMWFGTPNVSITAIKKTSPERVRTILKVANWLAAAKSTEEARFRSIGIEGRHHNMKNGLPVKTPLAQTEMKVPTYTLASGPLIFTSTPDKPELQKTDRLLYKQLKEHLPRGIKDPTLGLYSPTFSSKGRSLETMLLDAVNSILLGRKPVSSWNDVVKKWRREGGDQMKKEYEKASKAVKA